MQARPHDAATESPPPIRPDWSPPAIRGPAWLAHRACEDHGLDDLLDAVARSADTAQTRAALALDRSFAHALRFRPGEAAALQEQALARCQVFRIEPSAADTPPLRLLAVMAPGGFIVNTPLDFLTGHLNVRLDLLYVRPGEPLPPALPEHDVAFFAVSESDPAALRRLAPLFRRWPRPALNDPAAVARLSRENVSAGLARLPGVLSPYAVRLTRQALTADPPSGGQFLIRPAGSHAGQGLALADGAGALQRYAEDGGEGDDAFCVTEFVDYRNADGLFRKYRVALLQGRPFLCHMAVSDHWMVHYLNAGMDRHADRRMEEAHAFATFDAGFTARHREALASIRRWSALDYIQLDCAEAPDGRLLVFEADTAALVHLMDAPDLFAYKAVPMRRMFTAFEAMLRGAARRLSSWPRPSPGA